MAQIDLQNLAHSYQAKPQSETDYALRPMNLTWQDGGAYALLGPSGCGKTTLLNIISGLIKPSQGKVLFDDHDVTLESPEQRNIAQVFQFPVIYDTMSVFDNLAFPLRNRGMRGQDVRKRVEQVAELLELSSDLRRRASGLSADAKQKISLGRGLVRSDVAAILFDEPLTVIDPHLKWLLRSKLKQIHQEYKLTLIYVTHDQTEALTFADKVVVMLEGQVVQVGTPQDLFENPEHTFVGYFIGSPGMNFLPCTLKGRRAELAGGSVVLDDAVLEQVQALKQQGANFKLGIRPAFIEYLSQTDENAQNCLLVDITDIEDLGTFKLVTAALGAETLKVRLPEDQAVHRGQGWLHFPSQHSKLYANDRLISEKGATDYAETH